MPWEKKQYRESEYSGGGPESGRGARAPPSVNPKSTRLGKPHRTRATNRGGKGWSWTDVAGFAANNYGGILQQRLETRKMANKAAQQYKTRTRMDSSRRNPTISEIIKIPTAAKQNQRFRDMPWNPTKTWIEKIQPSKYDAPQNLGSALPAILNDVRSSNVALKRTALTVGKMMKGPSKTHVVVDPHRSLKQLRFKTIGDYSDLAWASCPSWLQNHYFSQFVRIPLTNRTFGTGGGMRTALAIHSITVKQFERYCPWVQIGIGSTSDGEIAEFNMDSRASFLNELGTNLLPVWGQNIHVSGGDYSISMVMNNAAPGTYTALSEQPIPSTIKYGVCAGNVDGAEDTVNAAAGIHTAHERWHEKTITFDMPKLYVGNQLSMSVVGIELSPWATKQGDNLGNQFCFPQHLIPEHWRALTPTTPYLPGVCDFVVEINYEEVSLSEGEYIKLSNSFPLCLNPGIGRKEVNCKIQEFGV